MRYTVLAVLFLNLVGAAFGQGHGPYYSLGGFGNVLYPGTGHAPAAPAGPPGNFNGARAGGRFGGPVGGRNVYPNPLPANHPQHGRTVIVPYPVFYGGYSGYSGYDVPPPGYQDQPPPVMNGAPSVIINQNFVPQQSNPVVREYAPADDQQSGLKLYQTPPTHPYVDTPEEQAPKRRAVSDDRPTIYLIAFKDHSIVQALGYWMEGATLHYVSVEHTLNQASIELIDSELSQRLNDERAVEFKLPAK